MECATRSKDIEARRIMTYPLQQHGKRERKRSICMSLMINSPAQGLGGVDFDFKFLHAGPRLYRGLQQVLHCPCSEFHEKYRIEILPGT